MWVLVSLLVSREHESECLSKKLYHTLHWWGIVLAVFVRPCRWCSRVYRGYRPPSRLSWCWHRWPAVSRWSSDRRGQLCNRWGRSVCSSPAFVCSWCCGERRARHRSNWATFEPDCVAAAVVAAALAAAVVVVAVAFDCASKLLLWMMEKQNAKYRF